MNTIKSISAAAAVLLLLSSCKKKEQTIHPIIAPITEAVFAPGHIEAANQFTLNAMNDGYITDVTVVEGNTVKQGDVLFRQDNTTALIQQKTSSENLRIAEQQAADNSAALQQLQAQLTSAEQTLQTDKEQYERMQRLYTTYSVAKVDVDNAKLAYDNAVNNVAGIRQNIEATKLNLRQTVVSSKGQQQTSVANAGYYNIKSPGDYTVYSLIKRKGDFVRTGNSVAILGNNTLLAVLNVDETSIAKVKLGQPVLVELNTQKGITYTANVSKIYPDYDDSTQSYKVEATFDKENPQIINGTLLQANIIVAKKDKALLIPSNCLSPDDKVILKNDKRKEDTIPVVTGIVSTDWVEVLKGVDTTDNLIKAF